MRLATKQVLFAAWLALCAVIWFPVNTKATVYTVTNTNDNGAGSLRDAVSQTNATIDDDTINFNLANCPNAICTVTLTGGQLTINAAATAGKLSIVNAAGASNLIISGNNASRVFYLKASADVTMYGLTTANGQVIPTNPVRSGGGIYVESSGGTQTGLAIVNCVVTNNQVTGSSGGGIDNGGALFILNSLISRNSVGDEGGIGSGGGISNSGTLTISNSTINNNGASNGGGGIFNGGTAVITGSTLSGNGLGVGYGGYGNAQGSAISNGGRMTITDSIIKNQTSSRSATSVYSENALTMSNTTVDNNLIGVYNNRNGTLTVNNSTFSNNSQGGVVNNSGTLTLTNSTISGNKIFGLNNGDGTATITNATITNNTRGVSTFRSINSNKTKTFLRNSIIAGNALESVPDDVYQVAADTVISNGNNLIGNANSTNLPVNWQASDILNLPARIAPLANNGGATQTHALLFNSPAVNAGNDCVLTGNGCGDNNAAIYYDQRGFNRKVGTSVDIGAFEAQLNENYRRVTAFDFNGDGKADVTVFRPSESTWYLPSNSTSGLDAVQFGAAADKIVPADYDGDGKTDVASVHLNADNSLTWNIKRSRDGATSFQFGLAGDTPIVGDFDGDGKADAAVTRVVNNQLVWYILRSRDGFTGYQFGLATDTPLVGDFDGDGQADAAVTRKEGGKLVWYINRSQAGFTGFQFGLATDKPVLGDFDGDGQTDAAVIRVTDNQLTWYLLQSSYGFAGFRYGLSGDIPVPADYDGDGKTDVAVTRFNNGNLTWYISQTRAGYIETRFGSSGDQAIPAAFLP